MKVLLLTQGASARIITPAHRDKSVLLVTIDGQDIVVGPDAKVTLSSRHTRQVPMSWLTQWRVSNEDLKQEFDLNDPVPSPL